MIICQTRVGVLVKITVGELESQITNIEGQIRLPVKVIFKEYNGRQKLKLCESESNMSA
jgi:hypothetical protein